MLDWLKKHWKIVAGTIVGLVLLLQKKRIETLEMTSNVSEADKKDAVLATKQEDIQQQITTVQKQAEEEKKKTLTTQETVEFLKKL